MSMSTHDDHIDGIHLECSGHAFCFPFILILLRIQVKRLPEDCCLPHIAHFALGPTNA